MLINPNDLHVYDPGLSAGDLVYQQFGNSRNYFLVLAPVQIDSDAPLIPSNEKHPGFHVHLHVLELSSRTCTHFSWISLMDAWSCFHGNTRASLGFIRLHNV